MQILFWLYIKLFTAPIQNQIITKKSWLLLLLVILVLFAGIRNSIGSKSFGVADSYAVQKSSSGTLALNGFYSVYRTMGVYKGGKRHKLMKLDEALPIAKQLLTTENGPFVSSEVPLQRAFQKNKNLSA